jgi:hypothetical protein
MKGSCLYNNILLTACDTQYFEACLTLISHVQQNPAYEKIDQIFVYNLGMGEGEIDYLNDCDKVTVKFFGDDTLTFFEGYLAPKTYAWKMYVLHEGQKLANKCVFYLDAGIVPIRDFSEVFETIEQDGIFLVGSLHKIGEHITDECKTEMSVTARELKAEAITAGIQGYKIGSRFVEEYIDYGFFLSKIPACICGEKYGPKPHRHDQTIFSILARRMNLPPFQDLYKYSGWTGPNMHPDQVFWVHRRAYNNYKGLKKIPQL